jgi:hypothetical protein
MSQHDLTEEDDYDDYVELEEELIVFERIHNQEEVPEGFSAATVLLDASPTSSLKWDEALQSSDEIIQKGHRVVFDFDVRPSKPFSHSGQFQAYGFALTHFRETVWPKYKEHCAGLILHRSSLAFDKDFLWSRQEKEEMTQMTPDELLFCCRDRLVEYFSLLASHLPDDCPAILLFDCQGVQDPALFALLTVQDRFPRFRLGVQHAPFPIHAASWGDSSSGKDYIGRTYAPTERPPATVGLLLPPFEEVEKVNKARLKNIIDNLLKEQISFKIISQDFLTMEWEGLDAIILSHSDLSTPLQRALDGFRAANGVVISEKMCIDRFLRQ